MYAIFKRKVVYKIEMNERTKKFLKLIYCIAAK